MQIQTLLQNLGLNKKQADIYLACLELGSATVQEVADKSGVKRTSIYNYIEELKNRGLVTEIKQDGKLLLIPEDPNNLLKQAREQTKLLEKMLPQFMSIYNRPGDKPKVKFYQGLEGLRRVWDDMIASQEKIYGYSDYEKMFEAFPEDFLWSIPKNRVKNKQFFYCIAKEGPQGKEVKATDKKQMRETRLVKKIELDTEINIYGNKVSLLSFRRPYAGVIIEDRAIATSMKSIWQLVWNNLS